jgi:DNA primase
MAPYFDDGDLEKVRLATDIVELIGGYVTLKRRGQMDYWGPCPFHSEKTASFHVRPDRGMFHCFGCGKGGNVFAFLMEMERISFAEAVTTLAERASITLTTRKKEETGIQTQERDRLFHACSLAARWFQERLTTINRSSEAEATLDYLRRRGIESDVVKQFGIGFAEYSWDGLVNYATRSGVTADDLVTAGLAVRRKDGSGVVDRFRARLMFPIINLSGKAVAFGGRRIDGVTPDDEIPKYVNSPETTLYKKGDILYGLHLARDTIRRSGYAYLVEGYLDLIALNRAGILNGVASLGTALTEAQAQLLSRFGKRVVVVYDGDSAGIAAAIRATDILVSTGLEARLAMLPGGEDPDSLLTKQGREALIDALQNEKSFVQFRLQSAIGDRKLGQAEMLAEVRGLLQTVRAVRDPLQRDMLMNEIASLTGLYRDALERATADVKPSGAETMVGKDTLEIPPDQIPERDLLQAIIGHPALIQEAIESVAADQIEHPGLRSIYILLEQGYFTGKPVDVRALPNQLSDSILKAFIAESAIAGEMTSDESAQQAMHDCVDRIRRRMLLREKQELTQLIRQQTDQPNGGRELLGRLADVERQLRLLQSLNRGS